MTAPLATQRLTKPLLLIAAALTSIAFGVWGAQRGLAALTGAGLGVLNWFALRWLMQRLVLVQAAQRAAISLLLIAKIGLLMAIVFILINRVALDPIGLAFGLSVLFIGPVLAGLLTQGTDPTRSLDPTAARTAREER